MPRFFMVRVFRIVAMIGCVTAGSAAQAVPFFYDEAIEGDIRATVGNIPLFQFDAGNNVIAGSNSISGEPGSPIADFDLFNFVVPQNSQLQFVSIEFDSFDVIKNYVAVGPSFDIFRDAFNGGAGQRIASSRTPTSSFTDVLTSIGPQNLFTNLPIGPGTYDWVNGYGREFETFADSFARWDYRLTFGVESVSVPEPGTLTIFALGLGLLFVVSRRRRFGGGVL